MYSLLKKLQAPIGPSGLESPVARVIREEIAPYVDTIRTDAMGNLIAIKNGKSENPRKIMIAAHMDHIGYIVTGFEKEGFLRVTRVGGISLDMSLTRHVVFAGGVHGVLVSEPVKEGDKRAFKDLFIDIGAESQEEAEKIVSLGDVAVYAPDVMMLGEHKVAAPAMDDRAACAMLVKLLQQIGDTENTIQAVFTVQEEVGCRGAKTASFALEPDEGIAIDVTLWGDTPGTKEPNISLGKGIAVKFRDGVSISNPQMRDRFLSLAEQNGIKAQREVLPYAGTDAGAMQQSRGGIPVCTLSIPCRYVHSACEVVDLRDMEEGVKLLQCYLED